MDENKKVVVNLPEGTTQAEIIVREGEAPAVLAPKPPVKIDLSGVIGAPVEFLELRRYDSEQINPLRCHVLVDREQVSITLINQVFYKWFDSFMYRNNTTFTGCGFYTALKIPFFNVDLFCFHSQQFLQPEPGVNVDQYSVHPRFIFYFPKCINLIRCER